MDSFVLFPLLCLKVNKLTPPHPPHQLLVTQEKDGGRVNGVSVLGQVAMETSSGTPTSVGENKPD